TLDGGDGIDTATYADSPEGVTVSLADHIAAFGDADGDILDSIENLTGSAYVDALTGDNGVNVLDGLDGNDGLEGRDGDDTLEGGAGADILKGGPGHDTASYSDSASGVTVSLIDHTAAGGAADGDTLDSIENLTGSDHPDTLSGDDGGNVLFGLDG